MIILHGDNKMKISPHWDWLSMMLYIIMGIIGAMAVRNVNKKNGIHRCTYQKKSYYSYVIWGIIWVVFASFRYVASQIGGMDASAYIQYFDVCLKPGDYWYAEHMDLLYRILNKAIRTITSDYHLLFFVVYGIIVYSYIVFVEEFRFPRMSYIPLILMAYIYIRGFTSIRTNLGASCVLISIVYLHRNKNGRAIIFAIASALFQVTSLIYAGFLPFYFFYKKKNVKMRTCIIWIAAAAVVGRIGQYIIANFNIPFLSHGSYRWYAVYSQQGQTFFTNFWKIAFSQMLLGFALAYLWRPLRKDIFIRYEKDGEKIEFIKLLVIYDIILIPVTYVLGIWRGYEYLYIARLMLWAELIPLLKRRIAASSKFFYNVVIFVVFIGWMIFRQYNTWEDSGLMPYVFEPLRNILGS